MSKDPFKGLLFVGDPHVEARNPEFRSDIYPEAILEKIRWVLEYARKNVLLPVFLGDLFDKPRNNPTWLVGRLIDLLIDADAIGIYGNHDCAEPTLTENDSLMILVKAGCLRLVSRERPWRGVIAGRPVLIGGSSYRQRIPESISVTEFCEGSLFAENTFGVWISHHDVLSPGYESGRFSPFEIPNIDVLVNGHIHTRSDPVVKGQTTWMTPGNISRRSRSEKSRVQFPAVLQLDLTESDARFRYIEVPHRHFDEVFHDPIDDRQLEHGASAFVAGLHELRLRKTSSGAGLNSFLKKNLEQFSDPVADEIRSLAGEVTGENI